MTHAELSRPEPSGPPPRPSRPRWLFVFAVLAALAFLIGGFGGSYQGKLSDVQKNDNSAFLPASAESTKVDTETKKFNSTQDVPGFIVYQRGSGLTAADKAKIARDVTRIKALPAVDADQMGDAQYSQDGTAASISVPLVASHGSTNLTGPQLSTGEKGVIKIAQGGNPPGLVAHSAGAGGILVALIDSFQGIDGKLLVIAGIVVIALLLLVYRSPVLWFFPLFSAVLALGLSSIIVYVLAKNDVITLNGQSQGILSVLVIGAGTDYALLLVSRYREELHDYDSRIDAMIRAWRGAAPAIFASACTVVIGLLCLLASQLNSNRGLGPVCAIGIACTLFVMLLFLPVALVLSGRWVFWPRVPHVDHAVDIATHGLWGRIAASVGRHPRRYWAATGIVLFAGVSLVPGLRTQGLATVDSFTNTPDAIVGQHIFDAHFDPGSGTPAVITVNADRADAVMATASGIPGVSSAAGSVCLQPDYGKVAAAAKQPGGLEAIIKSTVADAVAGARAKALGQTPTAAQLAAMALRPGCLPAALSVMPIDGRTVINAQLTASYDTQDAYDAISALRTALHALPGADAEVGGQAAIQSDTLSASRHDRDLIIPLVLMVILLVLMVLLRAILAPLLLIATVVLSFTATLGVCALVFNHVFHFANADPSFPLFAFIFLVALGIDYNIFLMTRVREETLEFGTRSGVLRGLSVTGGVITSAGCVLASTFAVLGVLPLVFLAEIGFAVAFGVLLDTFVVRSLLVPALSYEIGPQIWWPSRLGTVEQPG